MNRVDFMSQLERLLQGIAPGEREEALQYYNDYFDDAGSENEQEVIEALGNPARVAENIKRDLLGSGYGGEPAPKAQPSDRALMEYGKESEAASSGENEDNSTSSRTSEQNDGNSYFNHVGYSDGHYHNEAEEKPAEKAGMPPWAVALLATLLVLCSPALLGVVCVVFGIIVFWYAVVLAAGVAAAVMLIVLVVLVVTGIICCFVNPWAGMALVGGGLLCGGIGLIFLMVTVAMVGITPAFWRGMKRLFGRKGAKA